MRIIILIILCTNFSYLSSQLLPGGKYDEFENKSINQKEDIQNSFVLLNVKSFTYDDKINVDLGLGFNYNIKNNLFLNFNINYLFTQGVQFQITEESDLKGILSHTYGGLGLFYRVNIFDDISIFSGVALGVSFLSYSTSGSLGFFEDFTGEWLWYAEPSLYINYDISKSISIILGVNYRYLSETDRYFGLRNNKLNVFMLNTGIGFKL